MSLKYEVCREYNIKWQLYRRHGEDHRVGGPASFCQNGNNWWIQYNKLHRLGGPAENCGKLLCYFIRGKFHTKEEYESKIRS